MEGIADYVTRNAGSCVRELVDFVSLPNNVFDAQEILMNARWLKRVMEERGIRVEMWATPSGRPLVYGELMTPGAHSTILFYGHYDGVPVEEDSWHSKPYCPVLRESLPSDGNAADWSTIPFPRDGVIQPEWRLFGRSVADSKNAIIAMLLALDALRANGAVPSVNIKFLFDGEEEVESPSLASNLEAHKQQLKADFVISASGETHQSGLATVELGIRGLLQIDLEVYTATVDMHSGHFGNFTPNAAFHLAKLLTSLKSDDGLVSIEGFYDDVISLSDAEKRAIDAIPKIENDVMQQFGISKAEIPKKTLQELINLPTLNVRGIQGGYVGDSARNIIPSTALAELDIRLVKGMDPNRTFARFLTHVRNQNWTVTESEPTRDELHRNKKLVRVVKKAGFRATRTSLNSAAASHVVEAVKRVAGSNMVVMPTEGGSLPLFMFEDMGMPVIGLPTSNFDCNQHTHDENLKLAYFFRAIEIFAAVMAG